MTPAEGSRTSSTSSAMDQLLLVGVLSRRSPVQQRHLNISPRIGAWGFAKSITGYGIGGTVNTATQDARCRAMHPVLLSSGIEKT